MAMINCPECGQEISDKADMCPSCGYPIKTHKKAVPLKKICIVIAIILFILACFLLFFLSNRLNDEEKADVNKVIVAINNIEEVQINSDSEIVEAENLYNALSKKCQRHVKNHKELLSAREKFNNLKAEETTELITQIGTVTLDNQDTVEKANKAFESLSDEQKQLVNNADELLSAVEKVSKLRVEDANSKISAIGTITLDSENKIIEARKAYDVLSDEDKSKVQKYNDLVLAEEEYEKLSVENCISLINNIGEVTLDSEEKIDCAQKTYTLLPKELREKVTNYDILENANNKYKELVKVEEDKKKTLNPGDSFSTSNWEIIYENSNITAKILPNSLSGYYTYYYADDNETFIDIIFQIKNINTDILKIEDLVKNCKVEYEESTLTKNYTLYTSSGSRIEQVYMWNTLDALDSTTLHVAIVMPREVQTNDKNVAVRFTIAGEEKIIYVR